MTNLEVFAEKIENFENLSGASQIDFFVLYLSENKPEGISAKDVLECFNCLNLKQYSNISAYLAVNSISKNKPIKFLKKRNGYCVERKFKQTLESKIGIPQKTIVTGQLFCLELVKDTRQYIENVAYQANACYEHGLYDAACVMMRKLLETLIIELFEKNKIQDKIKDSKGCFFYLSELIVELRAEKSWTLGRNTSSGLSGMKKLGDMSAHNRRFNAKKSDIDKVKDELRIVIEELVHLINFAQNT
jgi:hypothetical protein